MFSVIISLVLWKFTSTPSNWCIQFHGMRDHDWPCRRLIAHAGPVSRAHDRLRLGPHEIRAPSARRGLQSYVCGTLWRSRGYRFSSTTVVPACPVQPYKLAVQTWWIFFVIPFVWRICHVRTYVGGSVARSTYLL